MLKTSVEGAIARIKEIAEITDEKRSVQGNEEKVELNIRLRQNGIFESFKKGVWVDGDVNFDHDYTIQKTENDMAGKLVAAVSAGKTEKALKMLEDIVAEKKRRTVVVDGKPMKIKLNKDEEKSLKQFIGSMERIKDPAQLYRSFIAVAKALILNGQGSDAAVVLLKLISTGNVGISGKAVDAAKLNALAERIPPEMRDIEGIKGLLREALDITVKSNIEELLLNAPQSNEFIFLDTVARLGMAGEKEKMVKKIYGIGAEDYDMLFKLCMGIDVNKEAMAKILAKAPKEKLNLIIARFIGMKNARKAFELLTLGRGE